MSRKRLSIFLVGLLLGGGVGIFASKSLSSKTKNLSSYWSSKPKVSKGKSYSAKKKASSKKKKSVSKKKSNKKIQPVKHSRKKKSKRSNNRRASVDRIQNTNVATDMNSMRSDARAHSSYLNENDGAHTPWLTSLSGENPKFNRNFEQEADSPNREELEGQQSVKIVGVVVDADKATSASREEIIDGELAKGDGLSQPTVYLR